MEIGLFLTIAFFAWLYFKNERDKHKKELAFQRGLVLDELYFTLGVDKFKPSTLKFAQDAVYPIPVKTYLTTDELIRYRDAGQWEGTYEHEKEDVAQKVIKLVKARRRGEVFFLVKVIEDDDY